MLDRIYRSFAIFKLTRRYFRAKQILVPCNYYINGTCKRIDGEQSLSMIIDIVTNDAYGLKRFKSLNDIVDIGANIGIFSLHASSLFPTAKILAYEPCDKTRFLLEKNVHGLQIKVCNQAVGSHRGKVNLNYQEDLSASYISLEKSISSPENQECEMIGLDDVVAKLKSPNSLLKLDCEGSEYEIMQASSLDFFRYIVGEFHTCQNGNPVLGLETLKNRGFNIDAWFPFPDSQAGVFWASNNKYNS